MVLDGTPDDAEHADYLRKAMTALNLSECFIERPQIATAINNLFAEFERRPEE